MLSTNLLDLVPVAERGYFGCLDSAPAMKIRLLNVSYGSVKKMSFTRNSCCKENFLKQNKLRIKQNITKQKKKDDRNVTVLFFRPYIHCFIQFLFLPTFSLDNNLSLLIFDKNSCTFFQKVQLAFLFIIHLKKNFSFFLAPYSKNERNPVR